MNQNKNEINLIELFSDLLLFLKKNMIVLSISVLIFVFYGLYSKSKFETSYNKIAVITSTIVPNEIFIDVLNTVDYNDKAVLAKQLNISNDAASDFLAMDLKLVNVSGPNLDSLLSSKVEVNFTLKNVKYYKEILEGLNYFASNNPFLSERYVAFKTEKSEVIWMLDKKLKEIDGGAKDETDSYVLMFEKKKNIENLLTQTSIMKVISEKETPLVNGPKSLSFVIILYTIIGIVVGVILGWLISFYKKAKKFRK